MAASGRGTSAAIGLGSGGFGRLDFAASGEGWQRCDLQSASMGGKGAPIGWPNDCPGASVACEISVSALYANLMK